VHVIRDRQRPSAGDTGMNQASGSSQWVGGTDTQTHKTPGGEFFGKQGIVLNVSIL
jgi:hypothetical protein